jgi:hypothetical protein
MVAAEWRIGAGEDGDVNMPNEIIDLANALTNAEQFLWKHALYLPAEEGWTPQSKAAILDPNECEPDQDEPEFARTNRLRYALSMRDIQGIVKNARQQKPNATLEDLFTAFLHYYDHDAFISFAKHGS